MHNCDGITSRMLCGFEGKGISTSRVSPPGPLSTLARAYTENGPPPPAESTRCLVNPSPRCFAITVWLMKLWRCMPACVGTAPSVPRRQSSVRMVGQLHHGA
jgi:hypothetical protein